MKWLVVYEFPSFRNKFNIFVNFFHKVFLNLNGFLSAAGEGGDGEIYCFLLPPPIAAAAAVAVGHNVFLFDVGREMIRHLKALPHPRVYK